MQHGYREGSLAGGDRVYEVKSFGQQYSGDRNILELPPVRCYSCSKVFTQTNYEKVKAAIAQTPRFGQEVDNYLAQGYEREKAVELALKDRPVKEVLDSIGFKRTCCIVNIESPSLIPGRGQEIHRQAIEDILSRDEDFVRIGNEMVRAKVAQTRVARPLDVLTPHPDAAPGQRNIFQTTIYPGDPQPPLINVPQQPSLGYLSGQTLPTPSNFTRRQSRRLVPGQSVVLEQSSIDSQGDVETITERITDYNISQPVRIPQIGQVPVTPQVVQSTPQVGQFTPQVVQPSAVRQPTLIQVPPGQRIVSRPPPGPPTPVLPSLTPYQGVNVGGTQSSLSIPQVQRRVIVEAEPNLQSVPVETQYVLPSLQPQGQQLPRVVVQQNPQAPVSRGTIRQPFRRT